MNHPDDDVLAAVALGGPDATAAAAHVRECRACTAAVAALRDTVATLREPAPRTVAPPPAVWEAVEAELEREPEHPAPTPAVPHDLDSHRTVRTERNGRDGRSGRRFTAAWVAGAAAVGLVVGVAGSRLLDRPDAPTAPVTVASATLDTLDTRQFRGTADVVRQGSGLDLTVATAPIDPGDGYLEVWLINKDLERMVSVGVLEPGKESQSFAIPRELLDQGYVIVDISREGFDDKPQHSGDSVVRGTLAT